MGCCAIERCTNPACGPCTIYERFENLDRDNAAGSRGGSRRRRPPGRGGNDDDTLQLGNAGHQKSERGSSRDKAGGARRRR